MYAMRLASGSALIPFSRAVKNCRLLLPDGWMVRAPLRPNSVNAAILLCESAVRETMARSVTTLAT